MKLTSLDLNLLVVFAAVHETRSVSKAAERLGLRQPTVSAALARLRTAFGDDLFVRAAGAMQPTPKAMRLAPGIKAALAGLGTTLADAAPFSPGVVERTFTIASTDYTTLVLLPGLMNAIKAQAPNVDVRVVGYDKGDIPDLIARDEIDLALGVFQDAPPRAVRKRLCQERFVGLCRSSHPLLAGGPMPLDAYAAAGHALVTVRRDGQGEIDTALKARGLSRRIALTLPHMLTLPPILETSDLLSALPERVALKVAGRSLQLFDLPIRLPPWRIEMLWNAGARSDPGSGWLRSTIAAVAAQLR